MTSWLDWAWGEDGVTPRLDSSKTLQEAAHVEDSSSSSSKGNSTTSSEDYVTESSDPEVAGSSSEASSPPDTASDNNEGGKSSGGSGNRSAIRALKRGVLNSAAMKWNPATESWIQMEGGHGCIGAIGACLLCGIKDPRRKKQAALLLITIQFALLLVVTVFTMLFYVELMKRDTTGVYGTPDGRFEAFFYKRNCMRSGATAAERGKYRVLSPTCSLAIPPDETTGSCALSGEEFTTVIDSSALSQSAGNPPLANSQPAISMPKLSDTMAAIPAIEISLSQMVVTVNGNALGGSTTATPRETGMAVVIETLDSRAGVATLYQNMSTFTPERVPVGSYIALLSPRPSISEKAVFVQFGHSYVHDRGTRAFAGLSVKLDGTTIIPIDTSGPNSHSIVTHVPGRDDPGYPFLLSGSNPANIESVLDHFAGLVGTDRSRVVYDRGASIAGGITVTFFVSPAQASALKSLGYSLRYGRHVCIEDGGDTHLKRFGLLSLVALFIIPVQYIFVVVKGYFDEITLPDPSGFKSSLQDSKFTNRVASNIQSVASYALATALTPAAVSNLSGVLEDVLASGDERVAILKDSIPSSWEERVRTEADLVAAEILAVQARASENLRVDLTNVIERWREGVVKWFNRLRKLMMILPILLTSFLDGSLILHKVLNPTTFAYSGRNIPSQGLVISMYMPLFIMVTTGIALLLHRKGRARRTEEKLAESSTTASRTLELARALPLQHPAPPAAQPDLAPALAAPQQIGYQLHPVAQPPPRQSNGYQQHTFAQPPPRQTNGYQQHTFAQPPPQQTNGYQQHTFAQPPPRQTNGYQQHTFAQPPPRQTNGYQQHTFAPAPPQQAEYQQHKFAQAPPQHPGHQQYKKNQGVGGNSNDEGGKARCHSSRLFSIAKWIHIVNLCIFLLVAIFGVYIKGVLLAEFASGVLAMSDTIAVNLVDLGYMVVGACVLVARLSRTA